MIDFIEWWFTYEQHIKKCKCNTSKLYPDPRPGYIIRRCNDCNQIYSIDYDGVFNLII